VLDLGLSTNADDYTGDLKLREALDKRSLYFCLSYCWGTSQLFKTTSATLEEHLNKICWSSLPKTYRDAVVFTRRMGVQYLWIDSMCIIQDNQEDWEVESATMCSIFQNATLVLAATASSDAHGGCFSSVPSHSWHQKVWGEPDDADHNVYLRKQISHGPFVQPGYYDEDNSRVPLLKRGWVYQERLLSPRILHFLPGELIWECSEEGLCECSAARLPQKPIVLDHWRHPDLYAIVTKWHSLVQSYTSLDLTYTSDKLPAISGIAKLLHGSHGRYRGDYLAGLWRNTLLFDLTWHVTWSARKARPPQCPFRAPTWSWASVDSGVIYPYLSTHTTLEAFTNVPEAHCTPKGLDNFGHLLDGYIIVRGPLRKVNLRHRTEGAEFSPFNLYSPFHLYVNRTSFGDGEEADCIEVNID
jgi:hypothetical protein